MDFKTLKKLLNYSKSFKKYYFLAILCALVNVATTLAVPVITGYGLDYIVGPGLVRFSKISTILLIFSGVVIVSSITGWLMNYIVNNIAYATVKKLRNEAFNKILKLDVGFLDKNSHGDILMRIIYDTDQICEGLLQGFQQFFTGIITIIATLAFMLYMNYVIALIVLFMTPLSLFVAAAIAKGSYKTFKNQARVKGEMTSLINEMLNNPKIVIAYNRQEENIKKFEDINDELYTHGLRSQVYGSLINPVTRFVNALIYAVVAVIGALKVISGSIGVGNLYTFLSYASQYTKPFNEISGVIAELQVSLSCGKRVFELIEEPVNVRKNSLEAGDLKGQIDIENVGFYYNPDRPILKNVSIDASYGQMIAIVGPTGSGKTTLINLLMRFYDSTSGRIMINGTDIVTIKKESLRESIGMVLQDSWLFEGTIYENIKYSKKDATLEEVIRVCKNAYAHDFIMRLPNGYNTIISNSSGVSDGQKQLLCIARIMLRLPDILLLDEATSNIDTRMEMLVQKALANLMNGRTSFVIAHRLSTIKEADKIIVLKDGEVVEFGKHQELLDMNGVYSEIYNSQFYVEE